MTDRETLEKAGQSLFGDQWQSDLARALDVNARTVRYWVASGNIPAGVWNDIEVLCRDRIPTLVSVMTDISAIKAKR